MKAKSFLFIFLVVNVTLFAQDITYQVAPALWPDTLGNHRAVLQVSSATDAVSVTIDWRRRDKDANKKVIIITNKKGEPASNVFIVHIERERGQFVFQPNSGAGTYYAYYMPWKGQKTEGSFRGGYLRNQPTPSAAWVSHHRLSTNNYATLPKAKVVAIEARTAFDSFYPMEVIAKNSEVQSLINAHTQSYILFPENRKYPIRMFNDLPYKWIQAGPSHMFSDSAQKNEYYVFQIGVFAAKNNLKNITVSYSKAPFATTCFNTEGYDSKGAYFTKKLNVEKGGVQPLWIGVDIPENAKTGWHQFQVKVQPEGEATQFVNVKLYVTNMAIKDRGDDELWRYSRLRWLNSRMGIDEKNTTQYSALQVHNNMIAASMAKVILAEYGLPKTITIRQKQILENPISFIIETDKGVMPLQPGKIFFTNKKSGVVNWKTSSENEAIKLICLGTMESDGYLHYTLQLYPKREIHIKDIHLNLPVQKKQAKYFMGMGMSGELTPASYSWKWHGPQDAYWIGDYDGGIYCKLLGATYSGPLLNLYHPAPPPSWYNYNAGGFKIVTTNNAVQTQTFTGERTLKKDSLINFEFSLLLTPAKEINTKSQFINRYYHNSRNPWPTPDALQAGVKIVNVHHANPVNPYINYPFISADTIKAFAERAHQMDLKTKIYYTVRELSNQCAEIWALRSLGTEIFADGRGGGYPWLQEHLVDHYTPQWFTPIEGYEASDAAILTSGDSRWYNYYIEGLNWLLRHTDIDGLYLDDVSFDRTMLKRMRKVMESVKPGCLMDLHSNTGFSKGPATQYTGFFPYIDKVWFGESFLYDQMSPANWLVESSGIPFGLMGDMLYRGGNPWRGMVYGMTTRLPWETEGVSCDPKAIWKVWDEFGIADAKMIGYWADNTVVTTSNPDVLATAYIKDNRMLIAVASWAKDTASVTLQVDWNKIGWQPKEHMIAPAIENYQPAKTFTLNQAITIAPTKGWLLVLEEKEP